jgi:hypothetical protein
VVLDFLLGIVRQPASKEIPGEVGIAGAASRVQRAELRRLETGRKGRARRSATDSHFARRWRAKATEEWVMRCPQCGTETADEEWNCVTCRMNLYWASQHFDDLARIRDRQGLRAASDTPAFLRQDHEREMNRRVERNGRIEHKVRQIARLAMRRGEVRHIGGTDVS